MNKFSENTLQSILLYSNAHEPSSSGGVDAQVQVFACSPLRRMSTKNEITVTIDKSIDRLICNLPFLGTNSIFAKTHQTTIIAYSDTYLSNSSNSWTSMSQLNHLFFHLFFRRQHLATCPSVLSVYPSGLFQLKAATINETLAHVRPLDQQLMPFVKIAIIDNMDYSHNYDSRVYSSRNVQLAT